MVPFFNDEVLIDATHLGVDGTGPHQRVTGDGPSSPVITGLLGVVGEPPTTES